MRKWLFYWGLTGDDVYPYPTTLGAVLVVILLVVANVLVRL